MFSHNVNELSLIRHADYSFVIGDAEESVREACRYKTGSGDAGDPHDFAPVLPAQKNNVVLGEGVRSSHPSDGGQKAAVLHP